MNQKSLWVLILLLVSVVEVHASVALRVRDSIQQTIARKEFPSIPSVEATFSYEDVEEPSDFTPIVERLNSAVFPPGQGFQMKWADVLNILSDAQRKLILSDVLIMAILMDGRHDDLLRFASLFAHEISHYLYKLHQLKTQQTVIPAETLLSLGIPEQAHEHATIDALACELMRRAGYSHRDIEKGFADLFSFTEKVTELSSPQSIGYIDLAARRRIVAHWLADRSD